jgi:hypothetical protein
MLARKSKRKAIMSGWMSKAVCAVLGIFAVSSQSLAGTVLHAGVTALSTVRNRLFQKNPQLRSGPYVIISNDTKRPAQTLAAPLAPAPGPFFVWTYLNL